MELQNEANRKIVEHLPEMASELGRLSEALERIATILNEMMLQSIEARQK